MKLWDETRRVVAVQQTVQWPLVFVTLSAFESSRPSVCLVVSPRAGPTSSTDANTDGRWADGADVKLIPTTQRPVTIAANYGRRGRASGRRRRLSAVSKAASWRPWAGVVASVRVWSIAVGLRREAVATDGVLTVVKFNRCSHFSDVIGQA